MKYSDIREATFEANIAIREAGLIVLTWGNASAADPKAGVFAIKPSGVAYDDLSAEKMVIVSIETGEVVDGDLRPSSDTPTHQRLYAAFGSIGGIVHTHSMNATSFAQVGRPIPCMGTTHADHFAGEVPVTRHPTIEEIQAGYEAATGDIIVEHFRSAGIDPLHVPAVLLPHHGPFAWGTSAHDAVHNAVALEAVAEMAIKTYSIGGTPPVIPERLQNKHFERKHGPGAYYGQPKDAG
ncbi:MAG: L-ribulose-5-phosphate 4-epimerase AraD [Spirochaetota bacterium]